MDSAALKQFALESGAHLFGVADLSRLESLETLPPDLFAPYTSAISLAVRLVDDVIEEIDNLPTPIYSQHYAIVNDALNQLALRVSHYIQEQGFRALPIPASQFISKEKYMGAVSHKAVALAAGLGWQGKSLLLVSPEFGPRVRLVTILTDAPLAADAVVKNRCGECTKCSEACPAGAIKNVNTDWHYSERDEAIDFQRCVSHLYDTCMSLPYVSAPICGVCIRACPWGRRKTKAAMHAH